MKTVPDTFGVRITSKDFATSEFASNSDCSLAKALKRKFPKSYIYCGSYTVTIDDTDFRIGTGGSSILPRTKSVAPVKGLNVKLNRDYFR